MVNFVIILVCLSLCVGIPILLVYRSTPSILSDLSNLMEDLKELPTTEEVCKFYKKVSAIYDSLKTNPSKTERKKAQRILKEGYGFLRIRVACFTENNRVLSAQTRLSESTKCAICNGTCVFKPTNEKKGINVANRFGWLFS